MSAPRTELLESFLQEAVFRSRGQQAVSMELQKTGVSSAGNCGLGEKAAVALSLSARGKELFGRIWPDGLDDARLEEVRDLVAGWVVKQDALDRKRNHFIKEFRLQHGFDRTKYNGEISRAFEEGLSKINGEETQKKREAAQQLASRG